jgi:tetratricopeptide (TPR) repeat protein
LLSEATDRAGRANVLAFLGGLYGLSGNLDQARRSIGEAEEIYEQLRDVYGLAQNSGRVLARIELLAGEASAADAASRRCCETFERIRDKAGLSTQAAELADALFAQARYEDAQGWVRLAQEHAVADDKSAQFAWRRVRAKLLAREGLLEEAQTSAQEALDIVFETDDLTGAGMVLLDFAQVLVLSERPSDATSHVERALALFDRKGNQLSAARARSLLRELAPV